MLVESIQELESRSLARVASAKSAEEVEAVRVEALGRKGGFSQFSKEMGKLAPTEVAMTVSVAIAPGEIAIAAPRAVGPAPCATRLEVAAHARSGMRLPSSRIATPPRIMADTRLDA